MPRILIIDDDQMILKLLQEHLTNEGYTVTTMQCASDGFQSAIRTPPDLIMVDVNLPDATGFQTCGKFQENPITKLIPIIMMTGSARWPNQQEIGKRMGASEYILKPFDIIDVGNRVHRLMGSKRPLQPERRTVMPVEPLIPLIKEAPLTPIPSPQSEPALEPYELIITPDVPVEPIELIEPVEPAVREVPSPARLNIQPFLDLSVEIVILVSRLPKTRAGRHIADQLVKCGTAVGARMQEPALRAAFKELRETGYWLMLIRRAKLLEASSVENLEKTCQDLAIQIGKEESLSPE